MFHLIASYQDGVKLSKVLACQA